jgi:hypothetical protein
MQKCLLQKSPPPSIYLFLPLCPSFSVSILYVAISERLPLLLMDDVNHRCANNTKKHVHSTTRERERTSKKEEGCCCCCFFNILLVRHTYSRISSNACTSHTFCLFLSLALFCCYIRVISTSWYPSSMGDDEKRARRRC